MLPTNESDTLDLMNASKNQELQDAEMEGMIQQPAMEHTTFRTRVVERRKKCTTHSREPRSFPSFVSFEPAFPLLPFFVFVLTRTPGDIIPQWDPGSGLQNGGERDDPPGLQSLCSFILPSPHVCAASWDTSYYLPPPPPHFVQLPHPCSQLSFFSSSYD